MQSDADSTVANTIASIVARHGLRTRTWTRLASLGSAMTIFLLDDLYVLRIPRNQPEAVAGIRTDPIVIPEARRAGVHTPQLIAFDDQCDLLPVPYGVYERVPGEPLDRLALPRDATPNIWQALGRDLALLHYGVSRTGPAAQIAANAEVVDPLPWLDEITANALIMSSDRKWFTSWLEHLAPFAQLPFTP
ncbi:MAG TPA: phosphotransferase, partial [Roseiflexaceae bacterium]|nr:phosphotransferase [Roseiflexaceae bacterium]